MRRTVLLRVPRKRMMLTLFAALLAFSVASVVTFAASLTKTPAASAQTPTPKEDPSFSVRCDFSHRNYDDPIVYPIDAQHPNGQPGAAHRHDFYGNKTTNYTSTYNSTVPPATSLTAGSAGTTCLHPDDKSAYWTPTLKWSGSIVKASRAVFYYRADYKDPKAVKAYPPGLKIVPDTHVTWRCEGDPYTYTTVPPKQCNAGLGVRIVVPDCLAKDAQGKPRTDSADHRKHMAYSTRSSTTGKNVCPSTHPISVPELQMVIKYPIPTSTGTVELSSGTASTMHADFFNAWEQTELERLVKDCINTLWDVGKKPAYCNNRSLTEAQTAQTAQASLADQEDQSQVKQPKQEKKSQELLQEEKELKKEEEELKKRAQ